MRFTIDVDTGGTFTDGFLVGNGDIKTIKLQTTPHDLTVCLADCVKQAAQEFGISVREMLLDTDIVRYSTTIATNTIIQRTGSKIGLIVSSGFKDSLYSEQVKVGEAVYSIIPENMITTVDEEINNKGNVIRPLDKNEILERMQSLIDMGARTIVVSLKNSHINSAHERQIKDVIKEEYPNFYLGSVRVFLSSDVSDQPGNFYRTNAALINAYVHDSLVKYLYKAEDELRQNYYLHPLMIAHSHGGVARVAKTKAIGTYSSGPVAGLSGALYVGKLYGFGNILSVDMGGTSLDIGIIRGGSYTYDLLPVVSGLTINVPMVSISSVGSAGGSIISLDSSNDILVGPQSAGAMPGPACFDFGGLEPTVTDADVVLGFIDPDYFLGGKMRLNKDKAASAIETKIAKPLNISVSEAAYLIKENADKIMRRNVLEAAGKQGLKPESLADFTAIIYGGAGPTHCCGFTNGLGFGQIIISPFASVLSAFGSSMTDMLHIYSKFDEITLFDGKNYLSDYAKFNSTVNELLEGAQRDIKGEGYSLDEAKYYLELVMGDEALSGVRIKSDKLQMSSESDVRELCSQFTKAKKQITGVSEDRNKVVIYTTILNALIVMSHYEIKTSELVGKDPGGAYKGQKEVFWSREAGYQKTPIYQRESLMPGNVVTGPAIVEAKDTTYVIPSDYSLAIDKYSNGIIKEVKP